MQYLLLYCNRALFLSFFRTIAETVAPVPEQVGWKQAGVFIYLDHSWCAVYCLFSIYIEFCLNPDSRKKKATKNVNCLFNPKHHSSWITKRSYVWRKKGKKKIYCWNVSVLFHISLIRQNKKAITLGQENTGHGCWHSITADTYWLALWK